MTTRPYELVLEDCVSDDYSWGTIVILRAPERIGQGVRARVPGALAIQSPLSDDVGMNVERSVLMHA